MEPIMNIAIPSLVKELIPNAIKVVSNILKPSDYRLTISERNLEFALTMHMQKIFKWSQELEGLNLDDSKKVRYAYVDLEYYVTPKDTHYSDQKTEVRLVDTIFTKTDKHIAVLGETGMGKTSSMKMIVHRWLTEENYLNVYKMPIVILFRDTIPSSGQIGEYHLTRYIQNELGLSIALKRPGMEQEQPVPVALLKKCVWQYLDLHNFLIILDGFDEIPGWSQRSIYREIDEMSGHLTNARIVLTSRTPSFSYHPTHIHLFEISPFNNEQILSFSKKWLGEVKGMKFFEEVNKSIFKEMAGRPLILSYLAMLYQINQYIPEQPKSLYHEIIHILIHKWDTARAINRPSLFESFNHDKKLEFLSQLAFELLKGNKVAFSRYDLKSAYAVVLPYFPNLPIAQSDEITNEIREHSSLIVVSGFDSFQFAHKSIQEYLAGIFISKYHPLSEIRESLRLMPYECAMATDLSSNPSGFFAEMIGFFDKPNLTAYLAKMCELKPMFPISAQLGYHILRLWEDHYSGNLEAYLPLLALKGVWESIAKLNEYYKPDHGALLEKSLLSNPRGIIKISRRTYDSAKKFPKATLKVPLFLIRNWHYVRVKFDKFPC